MTVYSPGPMETQLNFPMQTRVSIGGTQCVSIGPEVPPFSKEDCSVSEAGNSLLFILVIEEGGDLPECSLRPSSTSLKKNASVGIGHGLFSCPKETHPSPASDVQ